MDGSNGSFVYSGNATSGVSFKLRQNLPNLFRYLMIKRFTQSVLTICEVQVIEAGKIFCNHNKSITKIIKKANRTIEH